MRTTAANITASTNFEIVAPHRQLSVILWPVASGRCLRRQEVRKGNYERYCAQGEHDPWCPFKRGLILPVSRDEFFRIFDFERIFLVILERRLACDVHPKSDCDPKEYQKATKDQECFRVVL